MKTKLRSSGCPISSEKCFKNQIHESLHSCSSTASATRNMLSFPFLTVAANSCPPNLPFKWQPSKPIIGLQPAKNLTF
jgi:hypothetical protein